MPIYEYRCNGCRRRVQLFFRSFAAAEHPVCSHCQSTDLSRLPSRVARVRSESETADFLADPSNLAGLDADDPRSIAEWARRMADGAGVDMGDDYEEMMEEMEHGGGLEGFGDEDAGSYLDPDLE